MKAGARSNGSASGIKTGRVYSAIGEVIVEDFPGRPRHPRGEAAGGTAREYFMLRLKAIPISEIAEIVSAAFEEYPHDGPEDLRGGRLFRSVLLTRLKDRYGDDWVRAWNHIATRQDREPAFRQ